MRQLAQVDEGVEPPELDPEPPEPEPPEPEPPEPEPEPEPDEPESVFAGAVLLDAAPAPLPLAAPESDFAGFAEE